MTTDQLDPDETITIGEVIYLLTFLTMEIVAATSSSSREADARLESIANMMDEMGQRAPDAKGASLLRAFSRHLMDTEQGLG